MLFTRLPRPSLRPFVTRLWAADSRSTPASTVREHVLPTGAMHLVFRLSGEPLRVFDGADDLQGRAMGHAIIGGSRARFYIRDVSTPSHSVGAMLRPGAAEVLFGAAAHELSERHTPLEDLWGASAGIAHEQLLETDDPGQRLAALETLLARRFPVVRGLHPAVAYALEQFESGDAVTAVVRRTGYSHRHFIDLFRRAVGLGPKTFSLVVRFQKALRRAAAGDRAWAAVALEAGYSDQAHFNRDFLQFAGVSPTEYRGIAPVEAHHVAVASGGRLRR